MSDAVAMIKHQEVMDRLFGAEFEAGADSQRALQQPLGQVGRECFSCRLVGQKKVLVFPGIVHNTFLASVALDFTKLIADTTPVTIWLLGYATFPVLVDPNPLFPPNDTYRGAGPVKVTAWVALATDTPDTINLATDEQQGFGKILGIIRRPATDAEKRATVEGYFLEGGAGIPPLSIPPLGGRD